VAGERVLLEGDLVELDVTAELGGFAPTPAHAEGRRRISTRRCSLAILDE
jgi:hypothetical protein